MEEVLAQLNPKLRKTIMILEVNYGHYGKKANFLELMLNSIMIRFLPQENMF